MKHLFARLALLACLLPGSPAFAQFSEDSFDDTSFSPLAFEFGAGGGPTVIVPACTTSNSEAACIVLIEGESLVAASVESCSNTVSDGNVASLSPAAGTEVAEGSTVTMTVSTGACPAGTNRGRRMSLGIGIGIY